MPSIETKSAGAPIVDDLNRAFSAFKEANDERLAQIETRMSADVVTEEKLARIDQALDETKSRLDRLALDLARPRIGGAAPEEHGAREHKSAFNHYMRSGEAGGLKALEAKAMSGASGPDGGYLVPVPAEREILRRLVKLSPIRAVASVREISTQSLRRAYSTTGPAAGWVRDGTRALTNGLVGNLSSLLSSSFGNQQITPFAEGGVIASPAYFANGASTGLMGERGAEAVMPLARGSDGRLGVVAPQGNGRPVSVTVNIAAQDMESFRRSEGQITGALARAVARGQRNL